MKLPYILGLFLSELLLGASLWNLDWAMWRRDFYLYYPPFFFWSEGVRDLWVGLLG